MHRPVLSALLHLSVLAACASPVTAQQHPAVERGFSPDKTYDFSEIDSVAIFNGALSIRIPIGGSYPIGGSFSSSLTLTYASKLWDFEEVLNPQPSGPTHLVRSMPAAFTNGGFGWTLTLGRLIHPDDPSNETGRWQYLDPAGGRHGLYANLHPGDTAVAGFSYSRSGSYLRLHELPTGDRTLEFSNGDVHTFTSDGIIQRLEDRFGNFLDVSYPNATQWDLTDRHGRVHAVFFKSMTSDGQLVNVVDRVELPAFGGTTATYTFEHHSATVFPACTDTFRGIGATLEVPLLDRVLLPDGSSYDFTYLPSGCSSGLMESLTLPTLGKIEYGWGIWVLPTEGCDEGETLTWAQRTSGVTSRTFVSADGTELGQWTYSQVLLGPPAEPTGLCGGTSEDPSEVSQTTVVTPNGHSSVHYFSVWPNVIPAGGSPNGFQVREYGMPFDRTRTDATGTRYLSSEIYDGGTLKRSVYVRYEYDNPCTVDPESRICQEANKRPASRRTVYHDDATYADETFSDHDGLGHYRTATTGGDFPSGNVRTTFTDYNPGHDLVLDAAGTVQAGYVMWPSDEPWVLDTYTEQTVTEGGATAKVRTCFDGDTGFLLRQRIMKRLTPDPDDVIAKFIPGAQGNLRVEDYYGGDVQSVSTSEDLCNLTLPTSQYRLAHTFSSGSLATSRYTFPDGSSVGFVSTELTIDPKTGLASSSRDPAGIVTDFEYDDMGRLLWAKPAIGHGAWTQYVFTPATSSTSPATVQVLNRANGDEMGTILSQEQFQFDGFGRVWKERRLMPGLSWVMRETLYDALGQKTQVSEWADEDADPFVQHWTQFLGYDAFGRPTTIRPPDGSVHDVTMVYVGDRIVRRRVKIGTAQNTETVSETTERYDRQGRLYQVVEPSGADGANVTTTYTYDVGNRLTEVRTPADGVTQIRNFIYDNRSFLQSESHPEKDGLVTYSNYDARGHARGKIDGANDLMLNYDQAERLVEIRETGGDMRPLKTFVYASVNSGGAWQKGKLERATRFNYYDVGPYVPVDQIFVDGFECGDTSAWGGQASCQETTRYDVAVEETYTYGGLGGRVSQRDLAITLNGNTGETFTQGWTYTDLGNVASISYPECTFLRCTADGGGFSRTVDNAYTRGYLTAVTGYATSITYHPSNLVDRITHSNNVVDTYGADPNGMGRPSSIVAMKGTTTHWTTGTYAYDGAGNVAGIGNAYFLYDQVNRLTTGALPTDRLSTGTLKTQSYSYDSFGNIQSISGTSGRSTPTSSATNRLEGTARYDGSGNLTSWNGNSYEYDAFNMMTRMVSGGEDWLYVYTADDERVWQFRRSDGASFHRYTMRDLSGKVLRQYTASGDFWGVEEDYVYRDGLLLSAETPAGRRHFHLDHLGSPRLITDSSGQRNAYHTYYPFGEEATDSFQDLERMKFTGHERDLADPNGTGDDLDYMMARFCMPITSRFMSTDPIRGDPLFPQTWNRYVYALNNPIKYIDPDGRAIDLAVDIGFIILDIGDIAETLIAGEGVTSGQMLALGGDIVGAVIPFATGLGVAAAALAKSDDVVDGVKALDNLPRVGGGDEVLRVVEPGKPQFQLRQGEEGLSVFDANKVGPDDILPSFRAGSQTVTRRVDDINGCGLSVVCTPGDASLPKTLRDAHFEIRPGVGMTRKQFKKALKLLEPNQ